MIEIARTRQDLHDAMNKWRARGESTALVPTMGALHEGHIALVQAGLKHAPNVVATIFVNPKQFAANEDLDRYPRDEAGDLEKLESAGAALVYIPHSGEIYSDGFATSIHMSGPAKAKLEDRFRPQFFDGVATVVAKLLIQTQCDVAMFGEKDYQQLKVVTRMARDLDIATKIVGVPTVRESDGLAMSSRNRYLSEFERNQAVEIYKTLGNAAKRIKRCVKPPRAAILAARALTKAGFKVDYVAARDAETLGQVVPSEPIRLLTAAWLGATRLIDNIEVLP